MTVRDRPEKIHLCHDRQKHDDPILMEKTPSLDLLCCNSEENVDSGGDIHVPDMIEIRTTLKGDAMMIENVRKFKQALQENRELADQFTEELKHIKEEKSAGSDAQAIVQAAKTLGFDFTIADVEKAQAEIQELDPKELDQAAGGEDSWCMFDFACFTAVRHDTPDKPPYSCFKEYACVTIYHHDWKVDE